MTAQRHDTRNLARSWASGTGTGAVWSVTTTFETEPIEGTLAVPFGPVRVRAVTLTFGDLKASRRLRVGVDDRGQIVSVKLSDPEGITAKTLQHFPWARWLTMADQAIRSYGSPGGGLDGLRILAALDYDADLERALDGGRLRDPTRNPKRPGRRGLPASHYQGVAKEYMALRELGSLSPTRTLADRRKVSRNTAAGWVRAAHERGFLPPARGNRPG